MHFNDLIMRLRTQALGALTAIIALSGVVLSVTGKAESEAVWEVLFATFIFLTIAWTAVWIIDMRYYNELLLGAVEAIVERERQTGGRIDLSTRVETRARQKRFPFPSGEWAPRTFYLIVCLGLVAATVYAGIRVFNPPSSEPRKLEYQLERTPNDRIRLDVEPVKP